MQHRQLQPEKITCNNKKIFSEGKNTHGRKRKRLVLYRELLSSVLCLNFEVTSSTMGKKNPQNTFAVSHPEQISMVAPQTISSQHPRVLLLREPNDSRLQGVGMVLPQVFARDCGFNSTYQPQAVCPKSTPELCCWAETREKPCQAVL